MQPETPKNSTQSDQKEYSPADVTPPNGLSDFEKTIMSFLIAIAVPAGFAAAFKDLLFPDYTFVFWITVIPGLIYTLWFGAVRQGELENSVGGFLNQFTRWVIPTGWSWWIPPPFGKALGTRSVEKRTTKMTSDDIGPITEVSTYDGGQVEISEVVEWYIHDVRQAARYDMALLDKRVMDLIERNTRWFALYWDSDDNESAGTKDSLVRRKADFSRYIIGDFSRPIMGKDRQTGKIVDIRDYYPQDDPTSTKKKIEELGIRFSSAEVKDVNQPQAVRDARNAAAAESGQALAEERDIASIYKRIKEAMWGTSDEAKIKQKKENGEEPLMSADAARETVRAARKDITVVHVSGDGGDFTKGAVAKETLQRKG